MEESNEVIIYACVDDTIYQVRDALRSEGKLTRNELIRISEEKFRPFFEESWHLDKDAVDRIFTRIVVNFKVKFKTHEPKLSLALNDIRDVVNEEVVLIGTTKTDMGKIEKLCPSRPEDEEDYGYEDYEDYEDEDYDDHREEDYSEYDHLYEVFGPGRGYM